MYSRLTAREATVNGHYDCEAHVARPMMADEGANGQPAAQAGVVVDE